MEFRNNKVSSQSVGTLEDTLTHGLLDSPQRSDWCESH